MPETFLRGKYLWYSSNWFDLWQKCFAVCDTNLCWQIPETFSIFSSSLPGIYWGRNCFCICQNFIYSQKYILREAKTGWRIRYWASSRRLVPIKWWGVLTFGQHCLHPEQMYNTHKHQKYERFCRNVFFTFQRFRLPTLQSKTVLTIFRNLQIFVLFIVLRGRFLLPTLRIPNML